MRFIAKRLPDREGRIAFILLGLAMVFNATQLLPEVAIRAPALNDDVLHLVTLGDTVAALLTGRDPTDFWLGTLDLGYPLFHYYQHLPIVLPAALYVLFFQLFHHVPPLDVVFRWISYLLLDIFPLSIYWSMRRFGFARVAAALGGLVAPLISTNGLYGFDFSSYVWIGHGLYTQLWAMVLLPPTLALGYRALREGRGYFWAAAALAATITCNLIEGYIAAASLVLLACLGISRRDHWRIAVRLATVLALGGLTIAYFVVPFLRDGPYLNRSVWELPEKYDSYGAPWVLGSLIRGNLFDFGRFPSLTILVGVGVAACFWKWREERYRVPLALGMVWLLLYFGRPTWGGLIDLLPLSQDLQLHRLIAGVHLAGIYLIGIGLAIPWRWALARPSPTYLLAPAALTALLLYPVYGERVAYLAANARIMAANQQAYAAEQSDIAALLTTLRGLPPGRVYAGLARNWGGTYRVGDVPVYALLQDAGLDTLGYLYHALSLNADVEVLFDDTRPEDYNVFNVRYVVAPVGQPLPGFLKPIKDFGRNRLYEVATTGYFDLVGSDVTYAGSPRDLYPAASRWLASDQPRVEEDPAVRLADLAGGDDHVIPLARAGALTPTGFLPTGPSRGRVLSETAGGDIFGASVVVDRPSTLMLKVTYQPGWHATIDGVETATTMVLPSYVGVRVAPGTHQVRLAYQSDPSRLYLMILGMLTLAATGAAESWRIRRGAVPSYVMTEDDHSPRSNDLPRLVDAVGRVVAHWLRPGTRFANDVPPGGVAFSRTRAAISSAGNAPVGRLVSPDGSSNPSTARLLIGMYLLFLSVYLASTPGHFISTDHVAVYLTAQSLVERQNLGIKPINDTIKGIDGQYYARYQPLQSILSIPFYLAGRAIDQASAPGLRRYLSGPNLGDWGGTVPIFVVDLFDPLITPLTCLLVFLFGRRLGFSAVAAFATTLIFGLATGTWVYAREYFQHPLETLLLLGAIYILFTNRDRLTAWRTLLAGVVLALGVLTRINVALVAPLVLLYVLTLVPIPEACAMAARPGAIARSPSRARGITWTRLRRLTTAELLAGPGRYALAFGLPILLALAIQLWLNELRFGGWLNFGPNAYDRGFSTPLWVGLYGYLFTVGRSIFLYSPPIVLGVFAVGRFFGRYPSEALLFLGIVAAYLVVYSTFGYWAGGWSWGPRYLLPTIPFLTLPIAYYFERGRRSTALAVLLAIVGVGVQILGVAVNYSYVTWDWLRLKLSPSDAYLYVPEISPIPTHLMDLLQGRNVDLWLLWVYQQFGLVVFLLTLAVPVAWFVISLVLLRPLWQDFWHSLALAVWRVGERPDARTSPPAE